MIKFESIYYTNFLSVGDNGITISLDRSPSTLITAPNGSGKSTITDAITFGLFGKSYRGIPKGNMVNTINKKGCVVKVKFSSGADHYEVIRGIKPTVFEIHKNGKLVDQDAAARDYQGHLENNILGFSYKAFCQTCLLGTASYVPFMQLGAGHRREVIETLFGINIFSTMNTILKTKVSDWKSRIADLDSDIAVLKSKRDMQVGFVKQLQQTNDEVIARNKTRIAELIASVKQATNNISEIESLIAKQPALEDIQENLEKNQALLDKAGKSLYASKKEQARLQKERDHIQKLNGSKCPTCFHTIDESHVEDCVGFVDAKLTPIEETIKQLTADSTEYTAMVDEFTDIINNVTQLQSELTRLNKLKEESVAAGKKLAQHNKDLAEMEGDAAKLEEAKETLAGINGALATKNSEKEKVMRAEPVYKLALDLMKDTGIKSVIINQYLPVLNNRVNHYLTLLNFNVKFNLDENFNETLKSRNHTEFSYANFSAGEKSRIDLALLFAWRDVAAMKNSVHSNLLILDEIGDNSLDGRGVEDLIVIIGDLKDTNLFVVSHRGSFEDKTTSVIELEKSNGFTRIKTNK